jgi:hypothetical protein
MDRELASQWLASPLAKFKPWVTPDGRSPQRDFIKAAGTHKARIFRAGNRSGKSEINAWDHVSMACGFHPYFPKRGAIRIWVIGTDWGQGIGTVLWPKFKRYLPPGMIRNISYVRRAAPEIPSTVLLSNGSEISFKSAESGPSKFAGADLDAILIDEEIESGIVEEARARLLDRGGLLSVSLTPVANMRWVEDLEREKDADGNPSTLVVRASMRDAMEAGILDRKQVESFLANLPERKRRVRELGDFASMEGLVYQEFQRSTHCLTPKNGGLYTADGRWLYPWPLPRDWPRFAAMDFGFTVPSAVVVVAQDPFSERLIVERCLYASEIRMSRWGAALKGDGQHPPLLPKLEAPLVADWDAMERAELAACGIPTCQAKKDVIPGIEAVERALSPMSDGKPKLMFVLAHDGDAPKNYLTGRDDAYHLVWEMERYRYAEKKERGPDVKDAPVKRDDHLLDALRYVTIFLERRYGGSAPSMPILEPKENPFGDITPPSPWR